MCVISCFFTKNGKQLRGYISRSCVQMLSRLLLFRPTSTTCFFNFSVCSRKAEKRACTSAPPLSAAPKSTRIRAGPSSCRCRITCSISLFPKWRSGSFHRFRSIGIHPLNSFQIKFWNRFRYRRSASGRPPAMPSSGFPKRINPGNILFAAVPRTNQKSPVPSRPGGWMQYPHTNGTVPGFCKGGRSQRPGVP